MNKNKNIFYELMYRNLKKKINMIQTFQTFLKLLYVLLYIDKRKIDTKINKTQTFLI